MWGWLALACGVPEQDTEPVAADTDVAPAGDPYAAWLGSLGDCVPEAGDGRLNLARGCADGVCAGDTYEAFVQAFGRPACDRGLYGYLVCDWDVGVSSFFEDFDYDMVIENDARGHVLWVTAPFDGLTDDGLGVSASIACFVQELGTPAEVTIDPLPAVSGDTVTWYDPYISVQDGGADFATDSRVDALYLGGGWD
jgi:hypothetical protein